MANPYPYEMDSVVYLEWSSNLIESSHYLTYLEKAQLASNQAFYRKIPTGAGHPTWTIYFPEAIDLEQYFISTRLDTGGTDSQAGGLWTSVNATPTVDGTWVSQTNWTKNQTYGPDVPTVLSVSGIKAIRFRVSNTSSTSSEIYGINLWGTKTSPKLSLVEAATTTRVESSDLLPGTIPVGTSWTTTFRVFNNSGTSLDNVLIQSRTNNQNVNGGYDPGLSFSVDGGTSWSSRLNLGTIPNAGYSSVITARVTAFAHRPIGVYAPSILLSSD